MGALKLTYQSYQDFLHYEQEKAPNLRVVPNHEPTSNLDKNYYAFGSIMPGRNSNSGEYRYGFGGQEMDNEINGVTGSSYTAEFWQYDSRLGRRWNIDPVTVPHESPYAAFRNNPIVLNDPNGDCAGCKQPEKDGTTEGQSQTTTHTTTSLKDGFSTTSSKDWYWHGGSESTSTDDDGNTTTTGYAKGWYGAGDYKNILTGSSWGSSEIVPLNVKLALGDFSGFDEGQIDETDLTTNQLVAIRNIALSNFAKGKMKIDYADYKTHSGNNPYSDVTSVRAPTNGTGNSDRWSKIRNPNYILKTSFGAATLVVENGKLYVVDQYNFNNAHAAQTGKTRMEIVNDWYTGAQKAGSNIYKQFRNAGSYYGSENGSGKKVKILIKQF